jgi:hypothetical protein
MNGTKLPRAAAALLVAGVLVTACASSGGDDGAAGPGVTTAPPTTPTTTTPTTMVAPPTRPAGKVTVTGTVTAGVEPGCLLLDAGAGGPYLLVGGDRSELSPGRRVAVTGRVDHSLLSTCQQGEPLVVTSIGPAP